MAQERNSGNNDSRINRIGYLLINIRIRIAIIIYVAALALILFYLFFPGCRSEFSFITAVIGGASLLYSAYYVGVTAETAVKQLDITTRTAAEQINYMTVLAKKQKALDLMRDVQAAEMVTLRRLIEREVDTQKLGAKELYEKIRNDRDLLVAVGTCFGFWEDISIAIQHDTVDEKILYDSLRGCVKSLKRTHFWPISDSLG